MTPAEAEAVILGEMKKRQLGNDVSLVHIQISLSTKDTWDLMEHARFTRTDADVALQGYLANRGKAAAACIARRDANLDAPTTDGDIASNMGNVDYIRAKDMEPAYTTKEMSTRARPLTVDRARQASQLNAAPLDPSMSPATEEGLSLALMLTKEQVNQSN